MVKIYLISFSQKKCVLPVYCGHSMPLLRKNIFPSTFIKEIILNWVICFNFSSLGIRQPSDYLPYDGIFLFFHFSFNNLHRCLIIFGHFLHTCTFIIWSCFRHYSGFLDFLYDLFPWWFFGVHGYLRGSATLSILSLFLRSSHCLWSQCVSNRCLWDLYWSPLGPHILNLC